MSVRAQWDALKPGTVELGPARLEISLYGPVRPKLRSGVREITGVWCAPAERRRGHASALLREVCTDADEAGITLVLMPEAFGEGYGGPFMSDESLAAWYARGFGFFTLQPSPLILMRMPHEAQPVEALANLAKPIARGIAQQGNQP